MTSYRASAREHLQSWKRFFYEAVDEYKKEKTMRNFENALLCLKVLWGYQEALTGQKDLSYYDDLVKAGHKDK